jgi:hypothetical protein
MITASQRNFLAGKTVVSRRPSLSLPLVLKIISAGVAQD